MSVSLAVADDPITSHCGTDDGPKRKKPNTATRLPESEFGLRSDFHSPEVISTGAVHHGQLLPSSVSGFHRSQMNQLTDPNTTGYLNLCSSATGGYRFQEPGGEFGADYSFQRYELVSSVDVEL